MSENGGSSGVQCTVLRPRSGEGGQDSGDDLLCRGSVTLYYAPITFGNDDKGSCQKNLYHKARLTVRGEDGECYLVFC